MPPSAQRVLDLGCASGVLGAALKERQSVYVLGIEVNAEYAAEAARRLDDVVVADIEAFFETPDENLGTFDCLIAADVLEHLRDPWLTLRRATGFLSPDAVLVLSVPNVRYWRALWRVISGGQWPRDDSGIFDRSHLRWFTEQDAVDLVTQAGFVDPQVYPQIWDKGWMRGWRRGMILAVERTRARAFLPAQTVVRARLGAAPSGRQR